MSIFEEHDYIGLSEVSTHEQTSDKTKITSAFTEINNSNNNIINFKATELRLGLPGSESPHKDGFTCKVGKNKSLVCGAKRGFSDAITGGSNKWGLSESGGFEITCVKNNVGDNNCDKKLQSLPVSVEGNSGVTSSKAQVVGWPPIRSFRKNSMANNTPKNEGRKDSKTDSGCLFVKVSMDGAPYLRKVNLGTYGGYVELSAALEKMFRGFTMVDFKKGTLMDNLRHSEYALTYEDKDADWMLVGDVPWNMFKESCRRVRIMKSSDAVGLASKANEE